MQEKDCPNNKQSRIKKTVFLGFFIVVVAALSFIYLKHKPSLEANIVMTKMQEQDDRIQALENQQKEQSQQYELLQQSQAKELQSFKVSLDLVSSEVNSRNDTDSKLKITSIKNGLILVNWVLTYTHDTAKAQELLKVLASMVNELGSSYIDLYQAISNDIEAIKQFSIDEQAILAKLETIRGFVPSLGITKQVAEISNEDEQDTTDSEDWRQYLHEFKKIMKHLMVFKRHEKAVSPMLSPENQYIVQQNLMLLLNQIQYSVIYKDHSLYMALLNKAINIVLSDFALDNSNGNAVVAMLKELQSFNLLTQKVELNSLRVINRLLQNG